MKLVLEQGQKMVPVIRRKNATQKAELTKALVLMDLGFVVLVSLKLNHLSQDLISLQEFYFL